MSSVSIGAASQASGLDAGADAAAPDADALQDNATHDTSQTALPGVTIPVEFTLPVDVLLNDVVDPPVIFDPPAEDVAPAEGSAFQKTPVADDTLPADVPLDAVADVPLDMPSLTAPSSGRAAPPHISTGGRTTTSSRYTVRYVYSYRYVGAGRAGLRIKVVLRPKVKPRLASFTPTQHAGTRRTRGALRRATPEAQAITDRALDVRATLLGESLARTWERLRAADADDASRMSENTSDDVPGNALDD